MALVTVEWLRTRWEPENGQPSDAKRPLGRVAELLHEAVAALSEGPGLGESGVGVVWGEGPHLVRRDSSSRRDSA